MKFGPIEIKRAGSRPLPVTTWTGALGTPPKATLEQYLRAYGEIGWLHAVVSLIARSVAETEWTLNRITDGESEEITGPHPLKTLLNQPNEFQSGHDLMELTQIFEELVGEGYWHLDSDKGQQEIWSFPPHRIKVAVSDKEYITGYVFASPSGDIPLPRDQVIPFLSPNPLTPWRGVSWTQAVGVELDTQAYAMQHNRFFFYNGATMGVMISYPSDITDAEYQRVLQQFNSEHRGYGRSHKATILTGGATISDPNIKFGARDMDFVNMLKNNRDAILGASGVPYSMLGGTENVTYASSLAARMDFAERVIRPRLAKKKDKLNKWLVPKFAEKEPRITSAYELRKWLQASFGYWTVDADKRIMAVKERLRIEEAPRIEADYLPIVKAVGQTTTIELDYDNPVPTDELQESNIAVNAYRATLLTRNEARTMMHQDPIEDATGDEYYTSGPDFGTFGNLPDSLPQPKHAKPLLLDHNKRLPAGKAVLATEEAKEAHWRAWVKDTEDLEPKAQTALITLFREQEKEALDKLAKAVNREAVLIDVEQSKTRYSELMQPSMEQAALSSHKRALNLVPPRNPHTNAFEPGLNWLTKWLIARLSWAAQETTQTTADGLAAILSEAFSTGQSVDVTSRQIVGFFTDSMVRAQRISRTELMAASNFGAVEGYRERGVEYCTWLTAVDERTCVQCYEANGRTVTVDFAAENSPSYHPSDRCVWLPQVGALT